jgi:hypothetical protein
VYEVEHAAARIERLEQAIDTAVEMVPPKMRAVIEGCRRCVAWRRCRP